MPFNVGLGAGGGTAFGAVADPHGCALGLVLFGLDLLTAIDAHEPGLGAFSGALGCIA